MTEINISGNGRSICVNIIGYERDIVENDSDANWLNCYINIVMPPFSGEYMASLSTKDLIDFEVGLRSLSETFEGEAVLETDERAIFLRLSMKSQGQISIAGEAMGSARTSLTFAFDVDQTYLNEYRRAVTAALKEYPARRIDEK